MYKTATIACAFAAVAAGLPSASKRDASTPYKCYSGDGSEAAGWPAEASWLSLSDLFAINAAAISQSCTNIGSGNINNTPEDTSNIQSAIEQVSAETGVNAAFIFAVMFQESRGCVYVKTTDNGVVNPGLMQSHNGAGTCAGKSACPSSEITQMIEDGVKGTSSGSGLQQLVQQAPAGSQSSSSQACYQAARLYNSGSASFENLDSGMGATSSYASDIANTLMGWGGTEGSYAQCSSS